MVKDRIRTVHSEDFLQNVIITVAGLRKRCAGFKPSNFNNHELSIAIRGILQIWTVIYCNNVLWSVSGVRYGGRVAELWQNVRNVASCGVSVVGEWLGRGIELNPSVKRTVPREIVWQIVWKECWGECIDEMYFGLLYQWNVFVVLYFIYISEVFCKRHGMARFQGQGKQTWSLPLKQQVCLLPDFREDSI